LHPSAAAATVPHRRIWAVPPVPCGLCGIHCTTLVDFQLFGRLLFVAGRRIVVLSFVLCILLKFALFLLLLVTGFFELTCKAVVLRLLRAVAQLLKPHCQRVSVVCVQCDLPVKGFSACVRANEFITCQGMARATRAAVDGCEAREL
jgi:hypothetical protein